MKSIGGLILLSILISTTVVAKSKKSTFSINFENTELRAALELIAQRSGLKLRAPDDLSGTVSYSFANVTLEAALEQIAREKDLSYRIVENKFLNVDKGWIGSSRGPASAMGAPGTPRLIKLNYLTTTDALERINPLLSKEDKVIEDRPTNTLAFVGSDRVLQNVLDTLQLFDHMPRQIFIEAHIVELNKNQSLEFGFSYGDLGDPTLQSVGKSSSVIKNNEPSTPTLAIQLGLGKIDGSTLSARLAAAEGRGLAKILSRPKVITINNKAADITSGISYSIRTLAAVSASGTDPTKGITAGVTTVSAGLTLSVTPTIVGEDRIKLQINVSNSEPDETTNVDGIPGIISNSTNTEIIVGNGNTASVAGLVKNTFADSQSGVPFLSRIPILGWLFKSQVKSNRDKELMVFITPRIVEQDFQEKNIEDVKKSLPEFYKETSKNETSRSSYQPLNEESPLPK